MSDSENRSTSTLIDEILASARNHTTKRWQEKEDDRRVITNNSVPKSWGRE